MVVEALDAEEIDNTAVDPGLGVAGTIDHARNPRMQNRPGTHRTGLERHEQFAPWQTVIAERARRIAQRGDLGVRGRVAFANRTVETASDDFSSHDHDSANRYLAQAFSRSGQ